MYANEVDTREKWKLPELYEQSKVTTTVTYQFERWMYNRLADFAGR